MAETKEFKAKETEVKDSKMKKFREGAKVVGKEVLKETLVIGGGVALVYAATIIACAVTGTNIDICDKRSLERAQKEAAKVTEKVAESIVS